MKLRLNTIFLASLIPFFLMVYLLFHYGLNIAHWDDHAIRYSLINIEKTSSFFDKITLVFKQHNEHRIITTRLIALLSSLLFGHLDLRFLMAIGLMFLAGIPLIIKQLRFDDYFVFVSSLLLFHPAFYENTFWGMAAVQNFGVIFFAFLSAYFVVKENLKLAILCSLAAVFTSGNGIIMLIAVGLYFLFFKKWKLALIWIVVSVFILMGYYFQYQVVESNTKADLSEIFLLQKGIVSMAGSWVDTFAIFSSKRLLINYLIGFLNLSLAGFFIIKLILKQKLNQQESFIFIAYLFVIGSIAATAISRLGYGLETLIGSKYKIYSFLLLFLNFYFLSTFFKKTFTSIIFFSILLNVSLFIFENQNLVYQKNERNAEYLNSFEDKKIILNRFTSHNSQSLNWKKFENADLIKKVENQENAYLILFDDYNLGKSSVFCILNSRSLIYFPVDFRTNSVRSFVSNKSIGKVIIEKNNIETAIYQTVMIDYNKVYYGKSIELKGSVQQKIKQNW